MVWAAITEHYRLGLSTLSIFLTVIETWKSKVTVLLIGCLGKAYSLVHRWCPPTVSTHGRRGEGALWGLFYKVTNPIHKGPTLVMPSPPKDPIS